MTKEVISNKNTVLKNAHIAAMMLTEGHPELKSKVEALAKKGFEAEEKGDFETSHKLRMEAQELIDNAEDLRPSIGATNTYNAFDAALGYCAECDED